MDLKKTLTIPDTAQFDERLPAIVKTSVVISTTEEYQQSGETLQDIAAMSKEVADTFDPIIKMSNELTAFIRGTRDRFLGPLKLTRTLVDTARQQFEAEEEARRKQIELDLMRAALDARQEEADLLDSMGLGEVAEVVANTPIMPLPPSPSVPKTAGVVNTGRWSARVTNLDLLIKAVAEGKAPKECLLPNETFLNSMASVSRSSLAVPGVEAYRKQFTSVRRRGV